MTDDGYVRVTARVLRMTGMAFLIQHPDDSDVTHWIPMSCIHGGDEANISIGAECEFRLRTWKAKEADL